jgi:hypothetical protein
VGDAHTRWKCDTGASLIAEAMTPGPGKLGTLHGVIYVCPVHRAAAEEQIGRAGYGPEVRDAPPGHKWDPWPCGHVTAYHEEALAGLSTLEQMAVTRHEDGSHWPPYRDDWPDQLQVEYAVGCTAMETGLRIKVTKTEARFLTDGAAQTYHLHIYAGRTSMGRGPLNEQELYSFLDGFEAGVKAAEAKAGD